MIRSKKCFKCKSIKPLEEFYKHPAMADGHVNKCKECNKKDVHEHRAKNLDRIREYDRKRAKQQHRIDAASKYTKWYRKEFSEKYKCHQLVAKALRNGDLVKTNCMRCGSDENVVGHHEDYKKPLDVWWLCEVCHKQRHKELLMENEVTHGHYSI